MSVYKKLMQARLQFLETPLKKTGWNPYSEYHYFEMADFLPTALKIFHEVGLCGVVSFGEQLASLTITDLEDNSQILITSPMGSAKLKACHEVQNIGAVETYQRRYLWTAAFELVENDVLDAVTGSEKGKPEEQDKQDKPKNTATEVMGDSFRALSEDMQAWVLEVVDDIEKLSAREGLQQANEHMEEKLVGASDYDELLMAIAYKLSVKTRNALKAYRKTLKGN